MILCFNTNGSDQHTDDFVSSEVKPDPGRDVITVNGGVELCCIYMAYLQNGPVQHIVVAGRRLCEGCEIRYSAGGVGRNCGAEGAVVCIIEILDRLPKVVESGIPIWCLW
jgi:hypothetical protein